MGGGYGRRHLHHRQSHRLLAGEAPVVPVPADADSDLIDRLPAEDCRLVRRLILLKSTAREKAAARNAAFVAA